MFKKLKSLLTGTDPLEMAAYELYGGVVSQARQPALFAEIGIPDDVDGRFEMVILHAYLIMRRLKNCGEDASSLSQKLYDVMFLDMDRSLREMGVSDVRIGKHVKGMMQGYYGRIEAYDRGLDTQEGLEEALKRNAFGTIDPDPGQLKRMADYIRNCDQALAECSYEEIYKNDLNFAEI